MYSVNAGKSARTHVERNGFVGEEHKLLYQPLRIPALTSYDLGRLTVGVENYLCFRALQLNVTALNGDPLAQLV